MKKTLILFLSVALMFGAAGMAQDYKVVAEKSILRWTGKKIAKKHDGTILLKEAAFTLQNDKFTSGQFVIDMNSIVCEDVKDSGMNARLVGHLKSDDFFSVAKFPTTALKITGSSVFVNNEADVKADLTIKGKTHPVSFKVKRIGDVFQATVAFDRSLYDVRFGSGKFFENLGDNAIDDMILMDVTLVTLKK